ncbi:hypothetical protein O181_085062 [Austropuccinia psidii MF-1]|uniref:Uncharacterized protein n=1 Tax=Austropuccinia psidii MF-1 TaxID=1389203 RepID=A0A9Q3FVC9_9BASI|nr:hypothetical protein [Austropuccinia psidii MF-1]
MPEKIDRKPSYSKTLVVPSVSSTLVSLGPYLDNGEALKGYKGGADLYDKNGKIISKTKIFNKVLLINTSSPNLEFSAISGNPLTLNWRLGRTSKPVALKMLPGIYFSDKLYLLFIV